MTNRGGIDRWRHDWRHHDWEMGSIDVPPDDDARRPVAKGVGSDRRGLLMLLDV